MHLQLGAFPAAFLIQNNPAQLFAGPGHLSAPELSRSALQCAVELFKGTCYPAPRYIFAKIFAGERKGEPVDPGLFLGKVKERNVSQQGSINTAPADRQ